MATPITKESLEALRLRALDQGYRNQILAAQLEAQRLAKLKAAGTPPATPAGLAAARAAQARPGTIWHQDLIRRPVNSPNARSVPFLKALDKAHVSYAFTYVVTAAGGIFKATFAVALSRNFYIANVANTKFTTSTQAAAITRAGYVTLLDNARQYKVIEDMPVNCMAGGTSNGQRTIWPLPYGIGAGGSFEVSIDVPATAGLATSESQFVVEGWWDFSHV